MRPVLQSRQQQRPSVQCNSSKTPRKPKSQQSSLCQIIFSTTKFYYSQNFTAWRSQTRNYEASWLLFHFNFKEIYCQSMFILIECYFIYITIQENIFSWWNWNIMNDITMTVVNNIRTTTAGKGFEYTNVVCEFEISFNICNSGFYITLI